MIELSSTGSVAPLRNPSSVPPVAGGSFSVLSLLPATTSEVAAILGISVRHANARLQYFKSQHRARRTPLAIPPLDKTRGRHPHLWECIAPTDKRSTSVRPIAT